MKLLGLLNKIVPDGQLKASAKAWLMNNVLYRFTGAAQEYKLKDGITIRMKPLLLVTHSVGNFHLEGYELHYQIKPGDVVVDGGGFQGVFTLYAAAKVGPTGRVIVFEPDERLYRLLEQNVKTNQFTNVTLVKKGLWSSETTLRFDSRGNTSRLELDGDQDHLITTVPVTSLDSEVKRLGIDRVDFIKMNIEGAEIEAVQGCREVMSQMSPSFAIASDHIRDGEPTARRVQEGLEAGGYHAFNDYPQHLTVYGFKPTPSVAA